MQLVKLNLAQLKYIFMMDALFKLKKELKQGFNIITKNQPPYQTTGGKIKNQPKKGVIPMNIKNKILAATALSLISAILPTITHAESAESLKTRITVLEEDLNLLKRQFEVKEEVAKTKAEKTANVEFGKKGLSISSADKNYSLNVKGGAQFDFRNFLDDKASAGKDEFLSRRIRPVIEGKVAKDFGFRFIPDFAGSSTRVFDANANYKLSDAVTVRVGKFKPPVGLERLQSFTDLNFIERGLPTNLAPSRDFGAQLEGDIIPETLEYQIGVFNGNQDLGNTDNDSDDKKDFVARIFAHPFKKSDNLALQGLGLGVAGSIGDREGSATNKILPDYKSPGQTNIFTYKTAAFASGEQTRIYPQAYYYYNNFGLLAEYAISNQNVAINTTSPSKELSHKAWQVALNYVVTGEDISFKGGVKPKADFDPKKGNWGAVELAARVGSLDFDDAAFPIYSDPTKSATKEDSVGVGANWYLNENVKLVLNYDVTKFEGGDVGGKDKPDENALFSRLQFKF
jgi:phosphate-selective porin OprO/OprP